MVKMKYRKAVFIVVYTRTGKGIEYLILKRKLHWKGWEFPKGAIESLEKEKAAVKRELLEETGLIPIKIRKFDYSGKYDYDKIFPDRPKIKGQSFSLYAVETKKEKIRIDEQEHLTYKWVDFKKALKKLRFPNQKKSLKIVHNWLKEKSH